MSATTGTIYLLHFDHPYVHAAHYTGWTTDLTARLADHANGRGARLLAVVTSAGIGWRLARTWCGTRATERALKRQGGASRRCPLCGVRPMDRTVPAARTTSPVHPADLKGRPPARTARTATRLSARPMPSAGRDATSLLDLIDGKDSQP